MFGNCRAREVPDRVLSSEEYFKDLLFGLTAVLLKI